MFEPTTFSVALCTYQGEQYLQDQLDSIANQTKLPDEIVIRDDGSTDRTIEICKTFASRCPIPVHILEGGQRLGVASNFFTCAMACSSDWIVFADQDDYWFSDRLNRFTDAIANHPEAVAIFSNGQVTDEQLQPVGQTLWSAHYFTKQEQRRVQNGHADRVLARHVFVTGAALIVRRDWMSKLPWPEEHFFHDEWLGWFAGNHLRLLSEPTLYYRQHKSQQTGVSTTVLAHLNNFLVSQRAARDLLNRDLIRYAELRNQLECAGYYDLATLVSQKSAFIAWRLSLARHFWKRWPQVFKKLLHGDYALYSIPHHSIIKDLLLSQL